MINSHKYSGVRRGLKQDRQDTRNYRVFVISPEMPPVVLRRTESPMANVVDPAFKAIPKNSTCFLVWRIENMQVVPVPKDQYGNFYEGDSYIVYAASEFGRPVGSDSKPVQIHGNPEVHIHFWLGKETTNDEAGVAAYKTVELDDYLGGSPIQHRETQGNESARFKGYFKLGMRLMKGGAASGFNHVTDTFEPRLFHIKGRRSPTVTQHPISWEYFNSGDVFIIDTKEIVFVWVGRSANNIEKLQAAKIATKLRDEHNASSVVFVDDGKEKGLPVCERTVLNAHINLADRKVRSAEEAGADDEQEQINHGALTLYHCSDEDGTYKVTEVKTGPLDQSDLRSEDSFIVDNGPAGIWVWVGRKASSKERVEAMRNAQGYVTKKGYPSNTSVTRVVDGGEPVEFKMLFSSWKERNLAAGLGRQNTVGKIASTVNTKFDATTLHDKPRLAAESQLVDDGTGKLTVWRVENFQLAEVPPKLQGVFFAGDCYVVKYTYSAGGSEKCIVYYWLGQHSSQDEQGTAALKTVELDDQLGGAAVQVRVVQSKEPAHFLTIFDGRMIVLQGGKASAFDGEGAKDTEIPKNFLLQVRGNDSHNTRATQVDLRAASLNTNDVFLLKNGGHTYIWCGKGSTGDEREMAKKIANSIAPGEQEVIYEGQEKPDFWEAIGGQEEYANDKILADATDAMPARLFQCSNASGVFKAEEITNFSQTDLVSEDVMMLDAQNTIFVWVGRDSNKEERDKSVQTAMEYLKTDPSNRDESTVIVKIKQGYEPPTFTGFFGVWDTALWNDNKTFDEVRRELEGSNPVLELDPSLVDGAKNFDEFPKYPLEQLQASSDSLPEEVDKTRRELHLSVDEFKAVFKMDHTQFTTLPIWKQHNLKKASKLY